MIVGHKKKGDNAIIEILKMWKIKENLENPWKSKNWENRKIKESRN